MKLNQSLLQFCLSRRALLGAGAVSLAGAWGAEGLAQDRPSTMPDFSGAVAWLNSAPLRAQGLAGRVVLVQFWTFTCVNWQRTLPFVSAWSGKYRDQGLVVIGVHTPEFSFEHEVPNVREATAKLRIDYPVAIDSN